MLRILLPAGMPRSGFVSEGANPKHISKPVWLLVCALLRALLCTGAADGNALRNSKGLIVLGLQLHHGLLLLGCPSLLSCQVRMLKRQMFFRGL